MWAISFTVYDLANIPFVRVWTVADIWWLYRGLMYRLRHTMTLAVMYRSLMRGGPEVWGMFIVADSLEHTNMTHDSKLYVWEEIWKLIFTWIKSFAWSRNIVYLPIVFLNTHCNGICSSTMVIQMVTNLQKTWLLHFAHNKTIVKGKWTFNSCLNCKFSTQV